MSRFVRTTVAAALALCAFDLALTAAPNERSVSTSRQFIVYGSDARLRGAICDLAERMKATALGLLQERDAWKTPIVVNAILPAANLPEAPPARLDFAQTGFGLKLQLELRIGSDINALAVERELLRAIYLEMMYRARPDVAVGTAFVQPPDWLLDGTVALAQASDFSALAETLSTIVAANEITPLEEFLWQKPALLESPSRVIYRAYSAALIAMLTDVPDGRARLARFVGNLPRSGNDPVADFHAHFASFGADTEKLQKSWTQSIARMVAHERYRLLNCDETERQLAETLHVELREKDGQLVRPTLEEFPTFISNPGMPAAMMAVRQRLLLLSARANPLYRPIVDEYERIVRQLARKKAKRLAERLAQLRGTREHLSRRMSAIADYMNWFEATQSRSASGAFVEYMKAAELGAEQQSRRRDPISVYLDALESQFER